MQKKQANLLSIIFMSIFLVLSFMPIVFNMTYWKNSAPGVGIASKSWTEGVNLYSRYLWMALIIAVLAVLSVTMSVMQYLGIQNQLSKYCYYVPLVTTGFFAVISVMDMLISVPNGEPGGTATWGYYGHYVYEPAWGFYIMSALLIAVCVFSVLGIKGMLTETAVEKPAKKTAIDAADELKKYKELLDAGVLTEEEFESKKKQLLGL